MAVGLVGGGGGKRHDYLLVSRFLLPNNSASNSKRVTSVRVYLSGVFTIHIYSFKEGANVSLSNHVVIKMFLKRCLWDTKSLRGTRYS